MKEHNYSIRQIASLPGHEDRAWQVAWNPDTHILASCSTDKTVRLYSYSAPPPDSTEKEHDYKFKPATTITTGHTRTVRAIAWAPGGKSLAVGSFDSTISIWERSAGDDTEGEEHEVDQPSGEWEMVSQLEGHENECKSVAYSHSGTLLASCSRDKSVWVWEVQPDAEFECLSVMMEHSQDVKAVTFHPREDILASASYDDTVKLYVDDPSDDWYPFATLKGHTSTVWSISFSPCGNFIASSSDDKTIRIWRHVQTDTGSHSPGEWLPALDWEAHSRPIYSISWGEKVPGVGSEHSFGCIVSSGGDGRIRIWEVSDTGSGLTHTEICSYEKAHGDAEVNCVVWCPQPRMHNILATAGDDGMVNVWQVMHGPHTAQCLAGACQIAVVGFVGTDKRSSLLHQLWCAYKNGDSKPRFIPTSHSSLPVLSSLPYFHNEDGSVSCSYPMLIDGGTDLRSMFTILGFSCKACYAGKRKCQYSAEVYHGCIQCETGGTKCEPRAYPPPNYTMDVPRHATGFKGVPVSSSVLGLYVPELISAAPEPIRSDPALFDDRGFEMPRTRRRPRPRASHSVDASVSIGAIQIAGATTLVKRGLLQPSELVELHHLFITRWNPCVLVLDPSLHTLQYLAQSELLLSVVLAVAAQEYLPRPQLYEQLMRHARSIAGRELLEAPTIDTVQALLLLSLFPDWGASFDQNRSWLDLGLALDLADQLEIETIASTFDPHNASPTQRNTFRTWMICHNLDATTSLVFDRPSSLNPMPLEYKRWPKKPNDSYEGIVGVLTEPLQLLELHIKKQSLNQLLYGAESVRGISRESSSSPQLLDSNVIRSMEEEAMDQRVLCEGEQDRSLSFWLHMANITTAYSRLLLSSRYPGADQSLRDSKSRSNIIDSALFILESYNDLFNNCSYAKYAPGYLYNYGLLAVAVIRKLIGNIESGTTRSQATTLIERFSKNLRLSPTVTRTETNSGIFIQILDYIQRDELHRAGGLSEPLSQEPIVPMLTTVFPGWWRLYL